MQPKRRMQTRRKWRKIMKKVLVMLALVAAGVATRGVWGLCAERACLRVQEALENVYERPICM